MRAGTSSTTSRRTCSTSSTPATRDFLLRVSILGRLNGSLCDAVAGTTGSGALLADLERANLFISVDSAGEWYHPHQLFTEALRVELTRTLPTLVPVLHVRAARWLEEAGDVEAATDHAIAAHDVPIASRLVAAQVQPMSVTARSANTQRWLAALSWPDAQRDPELAFVRAVSTSLANEPDEAAGWLDVARAGDLDAPDAGGLPLGFRVDLLDGLLGVNDVGRAQEAAHRAVVGAPNPTWHGIALAGLGQAQYLAGQGEEASASLRVAVGEISDAHPVVLALAVATLGLAESSAGAEHHADPLLDRMTDALGARGPRQVRPRGRAAARPRRAGATAGRPAGCAGGAALRDRRPGGHAAQRVARGRVPPARGDRAADRPRPRCPRRRRPRTGGPRPAPRPRRAGRPSGRPCVLRWPLPARHATEFGEELSEREVVVLRLAADGLQQREIADQLFISYNTVKSHLKAAYRKLGVTSRDAAIERLHQLDAAPAQHPTTRVSSRAGGPSSCQACARCPHDPVHDRRRR